MKVMKHFILPFQMTHNIRLEGEAVLNKGIKNTVSDFVIRELDDFFDPLNKRLARFLGDERFTFTRGARQNKHVTKFI